MEETLRKAEGGWRGGGEGHFILQNYSSVSEIVSVLSL